MDYEQWEDEQGISPLSPEAYYAEEAWDAAVDECRRILAAVVKSGIYDAHDFAILLEEEFEHLKVGAR